MVSIVLVTYNRAKRLKLSIQDILQQTFQDFELIICDDCSPDNTEEVCREFAARDSRIRYFRHAQNKQMPGNLNFGIQQARFEYLAILHDGDRFRKDLIEQWYRALSTHESAGIVFNSLGDSDSEERIVRVYKEFPEGIVNKAELLNSVYFRRANFSSPIYGEAMVRKSLIQNYGFLKSEYSFYADVDLWMEILHTHDAYFCADTLIKAPLKSFQPQEFDDDVVEFTVLLFNMSKKHRKRAFKGRPFKLILEMGYYHLIEVFHIVYILLIVTKNLRFDYFIKCRSSFRNHPHLIPIWAGFLAAYPVLRPILRTLITRRPAPETNRELSSSKSDFKFS